MPLSSIKHSTADLTIAIRLSFNRKLAAVVTTAILSLAMSGISHASSHITTDVNTNVNTDNNNSTTLDTVATISDSALPIDSSQDGIIALVNETPILKSELNNAINQARNTLKAMGEPIPHEAELRDRVIDSLILRTLQMDLIKRAGIRPSTEVVNGRLLEIAREQGLNSLTQLQLSLDSKWPGSYASLRERIITEASLLALQQRQIASRVNISEQDIDAFLNSPEAKRLEQSEYHTIHIRIPHIDQYNRMTKAQKSQGLAVANEVRRALLESDDAQAVLEHVSNGTTRDYPVDIQGGDMGYHPASGLPTTIADRITNLSIGEVTPPLVTPEGIEVVKLLAKRGIESQMIVPQWHARHILVKPDNSQADDLAQQEIYEIYEKLRHDADFELLASTYSDDAGTAGRGGDLDWVSAGEMVPQFEAMMKKTAPGDFSIPFKTQFGWHIVQVVEQRNRDLSEQHRRDMARELLFQRLAPQARENWLQELKANAYIVIYE